MPLCTFGRHAALMFGATLFQSVLKPCESALYWVYVGTWPGALNTPGWKRLQERPPRPLPLARPDGPQTSAMVAYEYALLRGTTGSCTSHRTPAFKVSVGDTFHESCMYVPISVSRSLMLVSPMYSYLPASLS